MCGTESLETGISSSALSLEFPLLRFDRLPSSTVTAKRNTKELLHDPIQVSWSGPNNSPLPHDVTELEGNILDFANGRTELNGDYTCTATNPIGEVGS